MMDFRTGRWRSQFSVVIEKLARLSRIWCYQYDRHAYLDGVGEHGVIRFRNGVWTLFDSENHAFPLSEYFSRMNVNVAVFNNYLGVRGVGLTTNIVREVGPMPEQYYGTAERAFLQANLRSTRFRSLSSNEDIHQSISE